jgi:HK97 family phage major capsid protein
VNERLKKILAACNAAFAKREAAGKKADETTDATAKAAAVAEYEAAGVECDRLEKDVAQAKADCDRAKRLADLQAAAAAMPADQADPAAQQHIPDGAPRLPAQVSDVAKREAEEENLFLDYMEGKPLSGQAHAALEPKGTGWKKAKGGVVIPRRFADAIMPERNTIGTRAKALPLVSTGAPGSQLFYPEFRPQLLQFAPEPVSLFQRVFKIPTKSGTVIFPKLTQTSTDDYGGVVAQWTQEGAEKPPATPTITQATYPTHECSAYTELSNTLIRRSAIDVEQVMVALFRNALMHLIETAILSGDGNGKPTGILSATGIGNVKRVANGKIAVADLLGLESAIPPQLWANCVYVLQVTALQYYKGLLDKNDRPIWLADPANMGGAPGGGRLNGYPAIPTRRLPALGTKGDILFGDPAQYVCALEQDVVISRSEHFAFRSGATAYVVFAQVGGDIGQAPAWAALDVQA